MSKRNISKLETVSRNRSVITGRGNLEHLYTFKNFPVFMGCTDSPPKNDLFTDMKWAIDPISGMIQLEELIPTAILYQSAHMDGTGPSWENYYQDLALFLAEASLDGPVLEIGGGAGRLASIYTNLKPKAKWTIIEPNPLDQANERVTVINGFFTGKNKFRHSFNNIVFSQVLEHAYDPSSFLNDIATYLPVNGHLVFGHPDLEYFLSQKFTNAINFEHSVFITDCFVDYLLSINGFSIIKKLHYKNQHFFYHAVKTENAVRLPVPNKYISYKQIFKDFIGYHATLVDGLNKKIDDFKGGIYLFGAHIFSQYLLAFGLNGGKICAILDNSPIKQGKRLYGTDFFVQSPDILHEKKNVAVVLKVGIYRDEVIKQIREINPLVTILE